MGKNNRGKKKEKKQKKGSGKIGQTKKNFKEKNKGRGRSYESRDQSYRTCLGTPDLSDRNL